MASDFNPISAFILLSYLSEKCFSNGRKKKKRFKKHAIWKWFHFVPHLFANFILVSNTNFLQTIFNCKIIFWIFIIIKFCVYCRNAKFYLILRIFYLKVNMANRQALNIYVWLSMKVALWVFKNVPFKVSSIQQYMILTPS